MPAVHGPARTGVFPRYECPHLRVVLEAVTDITEFPDRGHSLTIDGGWREVAGTALDWLRRQTL